MACDRRINRNACQVGCGFIGYCVLFADARESSIRQSSPACKEKGGSAVHTVVDCKSKQPAQGLGHSRREPHTQTREMVHTYSCSMDVQ